MACLDMYSTTTTNQSSSSSSSSSDHKSHSHSPPMSSPRISFSNDFVDHHHHRHHQIRLNPTSESPPSSDFEFSVSNYNMMSADELFFKGKLLPFKECCGSPSQRPNTLREELLLDDDNDNGGFSMRPPKGSTRWKEILGLKKAHGGSRRVGRADGTAERRPGLAQEARVNKSTQELLNDGGSSCGNEEFGM
ncbi:UBA-like domain-containing protein [Actinidia chinensis var. chinensis]|uniref:UBA-like domain-containing protein n=1 Tax=Actinidia chinensis var. chinensis TaxID=1590841 RepID=A0A2R6R5M4_ACTCC|nr:UBA-like domain-containing protein [Actinidia chinensis var. chinensis]